MKKKEQKRKHKSKKRDNEIYVAQRKIGSAPFMPPFFSPSYSTALLSTVVFKLPALNARLCEYVVLISLCYRQCLESFNSKPQESVVGSTRMFYGPKRATVLQELLDEK